MNRQHARQLAELALATRDADLLAKACQQLLAEIDQPANLPLWQQPAIVAADHVAELDRALDNLPPVVYHQAPVQRVEVEQNTKLVAVVQKEESMDAVLMTGLALQQWHTAFGDSWRTTSEAIGSHQHREAYLAQLASCVDDAVEATPEMKTRTKMRIFWERVRMIKPDGWRVEHRQRDCGTYKLNEYRVLKVPRMLVPEPMMFNPEFQS